MIIYSYYSWFTYYKWWFSIAMLVYQRVTPVIELMWVIHNAIFTHHPPGKTPEGTWRPLFKAPWLVGIRRIRIAPSFRRRPTAAAAAACWVGLASLWPGDRLSETMEVMGSYGKCNDRCFLHDPFDITWDCMTADRAGLELCEEQRVPHASVWPTVWPITLTNYGKLMVI